MARGEVRADRVFTRPVFFVAASMRSLMQNGCGEIVAKDKDKKSS